jgi:hypothetical protein
MPLPPLIKQHFADNYRKIRKLAGTEYGDSNFLTVDSGQVIKASLPSVDRRSLMAKMLEAPSSSERKGLDQALQQILSRMTIFGSTFFVPGNEAVSSVIHTGTEPFISLQAGVGEYVFKQDEQAGMLLPMPIKETQELAVTVKSDLESKMPITQDLIQCQSLQGIELRKALPRLAKSVEEMTIPLISNKAMFKEMYNLEFSIVVPLQDGPKAEVTLNLDEEGKLNSLFIAPNFEAPNADHPLFMLISPKAKNV